MYGITHEAAMNVVEFLKVGPICVDVVNFEAHVGRDPEVNIALA